MSNEPLGGVKTTSDPLGIALQFVSRISEVISALTTFSCAVPLRLQDDPSFPLTVRVKLPTGSVVAGEVGEMFRYAAPPLPVVGVSCGVSVALSEAVMPAGKPPVLKLMLRGNAEPAARVNETR